MTIIRADRIMGQGYACLDDPHGQFVNKPPAAVACSLRDKEESNTGFLYEDLTPFRQGMG